MRIFHVIWLSLLSMFVLLFFGYEHINDFIAGSLSKKFKVPVSIGDFRFSYAFADIPFFELQDVQVSNPVGAILPNAFSCSAMIFKTPYTRYLDKQVVIQNLIIISPYFSFEFDSPDSSKGNWEKLMQNLKDSIDQKTLDNKRVFIEKLILHNINADLVYRSEGDKVQSLPFIREITLTDIRGSGSTLINEILMVVFKESIEAVLNANDVKNRVDQKPDQAKPAAFIPSSSQ